MTFFIQILLSLLITFSGFYSYAKVFEWMKVPSSSSKSSDNEDIAKASLDCHIQNNIYPHSQFILSKLLPRVTEELSELLTPQYRVDGKLIQVAESISYGDLFHVHVRTPIRMVPNYNEVSLQKFTIDQKDIHLQYHSFEYNDYNLKKWVNELKKINHPDINNWLALREDYQKKVDTTSEFSDPITRPKILSEEKATKFAQIWFNNLEDKPSPLHSQWVESRLREKIVMIDPSLFSFKNTLLENRSVLSRGNKFQIIRPLNLNGYSQPATVYFEELSDNQMVESVIQEAQEAGLSYIINSSNPDFKKSSFPKDTPWELHQFFADKIRLAATLSKDENYTFKHSYELTSSYSYQRHYIMSWNEKYFFSIRYSLFCKEDLAQLAK